MLFTLGVVSAIYSSDLANHAFTSTAKGDLVYRPATLTWLVLMPASLQTALILAASRRRRAIVSVGALLLAALILRVWNLDWQLPYRFHLDEHNYLGPAFMGWASGDLNPHMFTHPSLLYYVVLSIYHLFSAQAENFRVIAEALGRQVWDPRGDYLVIVVSRAVTAISGTGTVLLVYLASRKLFGRGTAELASCFLAVSFLHVRNSHYVTDDILASFLLVASFLFAVRLYASGRLSDYLLAGVLGGLATSTKYSIGLFVIPILVAHMARQRRLEGSLMPKLRSATPLAWSLAAAGIAFVLGTPFSVLSFPEFVAGFSQQAAYGKAPWYGQEALPTWWMHLTGLAHGFGLIPLALAALGVFSLWRRSITALAILLSFPAVYYGFMSTQQLYLARYSMPLVPFLAILAGCGTSWAASRLPGGWIRRPLTAALLVVALSQSVLLSVQGDLVMGREDTRVLADRWVSENLHQSDILMVDLGSVLDQKHGWPSRTDLRWRMFDANVDQTPWRSADGRPVYVAITSYGYDGVRSGAGDTTLLPEPYQPIEKKGRLVALFAAGHDQSQTRFSADEVYSPFWYVLDRDRPGPTVRIYEIDQD